jgi:hypothetical protein
MSACYGSRKSQNLAQIVLQSSDSPPPPQNGKDNSFPKDRLAAVLVPAHTGTFLAVMYN